VRECLTGLLLQGQAPGGRSVGRGFRQIAAVPLDSDRLPQDQKDRINANIDRVVSGGQDESNRLLQVTQIIDKLSTGPYSDLVVIELTKSRIALLLDQDQKRGTKPPW